MGWQNLFEYKTCHDMGFNYSQSEFNMQYLNDESLKEEMKQRLKTMADNNMVGTYLLSPHYMSWETYNKYPDIDPGGKEEPSIHLCLGEWKAKISEITFPNIYQL